MGGKKKKNKNTLALQSRIQTLGSQFDQDKINLSEFLEGLSLLIGVQKWFFCSFQHNFLVSFPLF